MLQAVYTNVLADACKLAYDYFEVDQLHLYADSWRQIASKQTKTRQADDHMQACKVLRKSALQRISQCQTVGQSS